MQAIRSLLLATTLTLDLTQIALAQVLDYQFQFVPMEQPSITEPNNLGRHVRFATKEHTVELIVPSSGKNKGQNFIYAFSRETGVLDGEVIIKNEGNKDTYYDIFVEFNDRLYVIYEVYDRKIGRVDVFAQEYILPKLISKGTPVLVGSISFDPKSLDYIGALTAKFKKSPDGQHLAFYFDRIQSSEKEQMVWVFVMASDLSPVWGQVFTIESGSSTVHAHGWEVNNSGTVYSLMYGMFKERTPESSGYTFSLFMLTSEGISSQLLDMPIGLAAYLPKLVLSGGAPRVGGFFMERQEKEWKYAGYYLAKFDVDLKRPMQLQTQKFEAPLDYRLDRSDLLQRADGGCFLVGAFWEDTQTGRLERLLLAISMDDAGSPEWKTSIPRHLKASNDYVDYNHRALLAKDRLFLLFPDAEENLSLYQAGMDPKVTKGVFRIEHAFFAVSFTEEGTPSYRAFVGSEPFSFGIQGIFAVAPISSHTFAFSARKNMDKKESKPGMIYITFD